MRRHLSAPETAWEPTTTNSTGHDCLCGDTCAPGCIWSSYAVSMGAKMRPRVPGQSCACGPMATWTAWRLNPVANHGLAAPSSHAAKTPPLVLFAARAAFGRPLLSPSVLSHRKPRAMVQNVPALLTAMCGLLVETQTINPATTMNRLISSPKTTRTKRILTKTTLTKRAGRQTMPTARRRVALPLATVTISTTVPLATSSLTSRTKSAIDAEPQVDASAMSACHRKYRGPFLYGSSAYMAADLLKMMVLRGIGIRPSAVAAGAVVVWSEVRRLMGN